MKDGNPYKEFCSPLLLGDDKSPVEPVTLKKNLEEKTIGNSILDHPDLFSHALSFLGTKDLGRMYTVSNSVNEETKHVSSSRTDEIKLMKLRELLSDEKNYSLAERNLLLEKKWKSKFYSTISRFFYKAWKEGFKSIFCVLFPNALFSGILAAIPLNVIHAIGIRLLFIILDVATVTLAIALLVSIAALVIFVSKNFSYDSLKSFFSPDNKYFIGIVLLVNAIFATCIFVFWPFSSFFLDILFCSITFAITVPIMSAIAGAYFISDMHQSIEQNRVSFIDELFRTKEEFFEICKHIIVDSNSNNAAAISNDSLVEIALNLRGFLEDYSRVGGITKEAIDERKRVLGGIEKMIAKRELEKVLCEEKIIIQFDQIGNFVNKIMQIYADNSVRANQVNQSMYLLTPNQRKRLLAQIKLCIMVVEIDKKIRKIFFAKEMSDSQNPTINEIKESWSQLMTHIETNKDILTAGERKIIIFKMLIAYVKTNTDALTVDVKMIIFKMLMMHAQVNRDTLTIRERATILFEMARFVFQIRSMFYLEPGSWQMIDWINPWIKVIKRQSAKIELDKMLMELRTMPEFVEIEAVCSLTPMQEEEAIATIKRHYPQTTRVVREVEGVNSMQDLTPEQKSERVTVLIDGALTLTLEQRNGVIAMLKRIIEMNQSVAVVAEEKSESKSEHATYSPAWFPLPVYYSEPTRNFTHVGEDQAGFSLAN